MPDSKPSKKDGRVGKRDKPNSRKGIPSGRKGLPTIAHIPTPQTRALVCVAIGMGCVAADIADELGVHVNTIHNHYKEDMGRGRDRFKTKLKIRAGAMALAGDRTMQIFLLKTVCGFHEVARFDDGDGTGKMQITITGALPPPVN